MEQRKDEFIRRPLYVYDLPREILSTLRRKEFTNVKPSRESGDAVPSAVTNKTAAGSGSKACSLCEVSFHTVEDQRSHTRSDFHNYNLKQKVRGHARVSEAEFEALVGDLDESLSGSDFSESEDDIDNFGLKSTILSVLLKKQATISRGNTDDGDSVAPQKSNLDSENVPFFWFSTPALPQNTYLGIYRAIFTNSELENDTTILDTIQKKQLSPKPAPEPQLTNGVALKSYIGPHVFMCMIGGGHFAAMLVSLAPKQAKNSASGPLSKEATVLAHKTFHRYTTRRKQGGSQSANDSGKGLAHSAGAGLRRYNEQALTDEVRLLLSEWKGLIDTSDLLFVRATGKTNRRTLFGPYNEQVLTQNDARMRGFPFSTRRATQTELMRSFVELTRVKVREVDEGAIAAAAADTEAVKQSNTAKQNEQSSPKRLRRTEEEETALLHTAQLQALTRRSKLPSLLSYLKSNELSPDFPFYPRDSQQNHHTPTPLHLAASLNFPTLVLGLLTKVGANPLLQNGDKRLAFDLAGDRPTRDAFRVARHTLGETGWDWEAAHVPSALSVHDASDRDAREKLEAIQREGERRGAEAERLKAEGPRVEDRRPLGKAAERGRTITLGQVHGMTAQEKREFEAKGLTPEVRARLERERRARAAEERMRALQSGGG